MTTESSQIRTNKRKTSDVWEHYVLSEPADPENAKAKCKYCDQLLSGNTKRNGTSSLRKHIRTCKKYLACEEKNQTKLPFVRKEVGESFKKEPFSQLRFREKIARMVIKDEQPFRMVEWEGFRELLQFVREDLVFPSRKTVARDVEKIYKKQKIKIQEDLRKANQRVSLTTDTWTSAQNKSYMVLTLHYIDEDWRLQRKIMNFFEIDSHRGDSIGSSIERCLMEWGIEKVLTVTVDNASSNDVGIAHLVRSLRNWKSLVLDGAHMHIRCFAHILNLIISDGLKEHHESIMRVRNAVKYVKSSPQRLRNFKSCIDNVKITFKGNVTLDVPTRWNSTYLMLDNAEKYDVAFDKLLDSDTNYALAIGANGHPNRSDWSYIREFCKFLKVFYTTTLTVSKSLSITSYQYVAEVCKIKKIIQQYATGNSLVLMSMAIDMQKKFDKYWGSFDKINSLLYVAILLDPRYKSKFLRHCLTILFGNATADDYVKEAESVLNSLFLEYKVDSPDDVRIIGVTNNVTQSQDLNNIVFTEFFDDPLDTSTNMCEVDEYLSERPEKFGSTFDLLSWWKLMSRKYPVVSQIAKDVFMIPISTVPSESAFSCGGRIVDSYRTSLLPSTVETLICTQSWIRLTTPSDILEPQTEYDTIDAELAADVSNENQQLEAIEEEDIEDITLKTLH